MLKAKSKTATIYAWADNTCLEVRGSCGAPPLQASLKRPQKPKLKYTSTQLNTSTPSVHRHHQQARAFAPADRIRWAPTAWPVPILVTEGGADQPQQRRSSGRSTSPYTSPSMHCSTVGGTSVTSSAWQVAAWMLRTRAKPRQGHGGAERACCYCHNHRARAATMSSPRVQLLSSWGCVAPSRLTV